MPSRFVQEEDNDLDYQFDWTDRLNEGEVISSFTITSEPGITIHDKTHSDTAVIFWVEGGTNGQDYDVQCDIVTNGGREDSDVITMKIRAE